MISICIPFASDVPERERSFNWNVHRLGESLDSKQFEIVQGCVGDDENGLDRSASRNAAAATAKGEVLVFVDADSIISFPALYQVLHKITERHTAEWGFPYESYVSLTEKGSINFMAGEYGSRTEEIMYWFPGPDPIDRPASVGGCVVVSRYAFDLVGGYDERFQGWGFEDRAFAASLQTMFGEPYKAPGVIFHLWHPAPEEEQFGQPHLEENRALGNRYTEAAGNHELMKRLIEERR